MTVPDCWTWTIQPNWAILLALITMQLGENESSLGKAYPWLLNLNHSPNWTIPPSLITVKPRDNDSTLGNDCPDHFLSKWMSCTNLQNGPFFETAHNCELRKNDCLVRQTIVLDHYSEWLPRRMIVLDHSPTLATRGIIVYGTLTIYRTIFITKMIIWWSEIFSSWLTKDCIKWA